MLVLYLFIFTVILFVLHTVYNQKYKIGNGNILLAKLNPLVMRYRLQYKHQRPVTSFCWSMNDLYWTIWRDFTTGSGEFH